ncbi:MAG: glycerol-3-phosphate 1-O-acyltransferase PlsY, partial [Phycisphaerae bacterium]|nr:glycerol-3-phosphate 1-O-acyltransferase PlsY [Phycisphaerae bacterium]
YLIGSTPFGVIVARAKGVDLRKVGSGNVGATNVARAIGRRWGYLCFALDVIKGFIPVLVAGMLIGSRQGVPTSLQQAGWLAAGFGAIMGHVLSFYLKFRGGKGVATALGVVLGVFPYFTYAGLIALGLWIAVTLISRYVSLGSVVAAAAFLPLFVALNYWRLAQLLPLGAFAAAMIVLIIFRHRGNIRRLLAGSENKIGKKRDTDAPIADELAGRLGS